MNDQTITCPSCGRSIPLSATLTHQLRENLRKENEAQMLREKKAWQEKEQDRLWLVAQQKAREKIELELKDRESELTEQKKQIAELESKWLQLRREKRQLEDARRKMEMEIERRVDEARKSAIEAIRKSQDEEHSLKLREKDKQLDMMRRTIEDLKRKSEQGSMQIQGEVQETDLKRLLSTAFPTDLIVDVALGIKGADLIQTVNNPLGQPSGKILWESKNTKAFSLDWLKKLKEDQSRVQADVCVLMSRVLPEKIKNFGALQGVWVTHYDYVIPLTQTLRFHLNSLNHVKQSLVGSGKKMEFLYNYLLSSEFKTKIESIVSAFMTLKSDLEVEKRAMQRIWSKREKEIERVITNTSGFYGDLQGVIGASLPKISSLELSEGSNSRHKPDAASSEA